MKKIFTLVALVALLGIAVPAQAQFKFGLKGGLNVTDMSLNDEVFNTSNRTGFFVGPTAMFTLPLVGLGIDASALYDQRESEVGDNGTTRKLKQQSINIPINLRYNIGLSSLASIYLAAGPQFGFNIGDKNQTLYEDVAEWKLNSSSFSVNVGAGVMLLSHLQVGANYNIVCGKTGEVSVLNTAGDIAEGVYRGRSNSWQISLAYYF